MDMNKLRQILKLSEEPSWAMRSPDQKTVVPPEAPMPIKQGGIPVPAGAPPPKQPNKMNPGQLKKAADTMLMGGEPQQGAAPTSAIPGQEGSANTSLTNALRMRRMSRKSSQQAPGSIGYLTGGMS